MMVGPGSRFSSNSGNTLVLIEAWRDGTWNPSLYIREGRYMVWAETGWRLSARDELRFDLSLSISWFPG